MVDYILKDTDVWENYEKKNFVLYMVSYFISGFKNINCALYVAKNVANFEGIPTIDWC